MKFVFKQDNYSDIGLIVKHGNKDNVVLFFDKIEDAALYRANLFRTNVNWQNDGFIKEEKVLHKFIKFEIINNYGRIKEEMKTSFYINEPNYPSVVKDKLCFQTYENICDRWGQHEITSVNYEDFENVKFITSLESSRDELYINIDFLPCGSYFVCLEVENRGGEIIKSAVPYYFKIRNIK